MPEDTKMIDFIRSKWGMPLKSYYLYDGSGRLTTSYEAHTEAKEGVTPCIKTTYAYKDTSALVEKEKEELSIWPVGADI